MWILIGAAGLALTMWLAARISTDLWVRRIVVGSYVVRILGAVALYYVSAWELPLLRGAQLGDGFWDFSRDSFYYDRLGAAIAGIWRSGGSWPSMGNEIGPSMYVASLYTLLGRHLLNISVLNAWWGALTVIGAVWLVRQFGASLFSQRLTVLLVGFWPSGVLWSTQLLKEPIVLAMIVGALVLLAMALTERRARIFVPALCAVACLVFVLKFAREYLAVTFVLATVLALVPWVVARLARRELRVAGRVIVVCAVLLVTLGVARHIRLVNSGAKGFADEWLEATPLPGMPVPAQATDGSWSEVLTTRFVNLPPYLGLVRQGMLNEPVKSVLDAEVKIVTWTDLLRYLPRGLAVEFLAPFPWQWISGGRGALDIFAGIETLLIYALLPCIAVALFHLSKVVDPVLAGVVLVVASLAVAFAIAVPAVGTLFRLRLQLIVLLIIVIGSTDAFAAVYERLLGAQRRPMRAAHEC